MTYTSAGITPAKTASNPFIPTGFWRARVVGVNGSLVEVVVPRMSGQSIWSNVEVLGAANTPMYSVGDLCYVSFIEGSADRLIVVGPVRLPSTAGPGEGGGSSAFIDPLEEYPYTREGGLTAGSGYSWPVRRSALISEIVATLGEASTSGDVVVAFNINGNVLASLTIAQGATTATLPVDISLASGELVSFTVTAAGTNASNLFIAARGRAVHPDHAIYIDEYAFGFGGAIATGQSHLYPARRSGTLTNIYATLTTIGSGATEFNVLVNDDVVASVSIPDGSASVVEDVVFTATLNDEISVVITDAPTGASNLGVFVRGAV
jgi:hypothetical protein